MVGVHLVASGIPTETKVSVSASELDQTKAATMTAVIACTATAFTNVCDKL